MAVQTWVKSNEGNFIAVDKVTHVVVDTNGLATIKVGPDTVGTFASAKDFFDASLRGLSREDVGG